MTYKEARREFERGYWSALIKGHESFCAAAKAAGINRTYMYKRLRRLNVPYPSRAHRGNWGELSH